MAFRPYALLCALVATACAAAASAQGTCETVRQPPLTPMCCVPDADGTCTADQVCVVDEDAGTQTCTDLEDVPDAMVTRGCNDNIPGKKGKCCESLTIESGPRVTVINNCQGDKKKKFECNSDDKCVRVKPKRPRFCKGRWHCPRGQRCKFFKWRRYGICVKKGARYSPVSTRAVLPTQAWTVGVRPHVPLRHTLIVPHRAGAAASLPSLTWSVPHAGKGHFRG